jgi:hypothetical protein
MNPTVLEAKLDKLGNTAVNALEGKPNQVKKSAATWSLDICGTQ